LKIEGGDESMNKFEIRSKYLTNEEIDILAELEDSC